MLRYDIKRKSDGVIIMAGHFEDSAAGDAWVAMGEANRLFGMPQHEVIIEEAIPEIYDEETGEILQYPKEAVTEAVPADYLIEISDVTEELAQALVSKEARGYLSDTDWYIIRELDEGTPCPPEIKQKRAEARAKIVT